MYWGFKKILFTLCTYVLIKILQNGPEFMQKLPPGFKNHMRNFGQRQTGTGKFKKLKFDGLFLSKKYIPSVKTLYTEDLTFNYFCEDSQNYLCHYIIIIAWVKVHQILMSFFKQKVSFSSKFGSLFSVMRDILL